MNKCFYGTCFGFGDQEPCTFASYMIRLIKTTKLFILKKKKKSQNEEINCNLEIGLRDFNDHRVSHIALANIDPI